MERSSKIYVAGHRGMVGSAIVRRLDELGYHNIIEPKIDLRCQHDVNVLFDHHRPDYVFLVAAKVGGIKANMDYPAEFIYDNLAIQNNIIHAAYKTGVRKLLFTGSSCIYPRESAQPIRESYFMTGELEPTNEPYAIAKIAGIRMCQAYRKQYGCDFISVMPTNSYGPNDNYDPITSHVLPALINKISAAKYYGSKYVELWGTGVARREFIYVDDMADAIVFLMRKYSSAEIINIGTGQDVSISELAGIISQAIGWEGETRFTGKMDGMPLKRLDVSKLSSLGWTAKTTLHDGIAKTLKEFKYAHSEVG